MKNQSTLSSIVKLVMLLSILSMSYMKDGAPIAHRSIHDEFMKDKAILPIDIKSRKLQAQTFRPYRTHFDWTRVDEWLPQQPASERAGLKIKIDYMKRLFVGVHDYFENRFEVQSGQTMQLPRAQCHGEFAADEFYNTPIEQDMLIVIKPLNEQTGFFAAAGACFLDNQSGRPVMGAIFLNFRFINPTEVNKYYLPGVFIHEMMHVMGFSNFFFQRRGIMGTVRIGNSNRAAITSTRVVEYARQYFNCPDVEGVPLENNGGGGSAGSHWEKAMFPAEVMNPQVVSPARISQFTIKLFEDLGWYRGKNAHQEYNYLKGDGCHTIRGGECSSSKSNEFCNNSMRNRDTCNTNRLGKSRCSGSGFLPGCTAQMPRHNAFCLVEDNGNHKNFNFESYGPHSRCIMADRGNNNMQAACVRSRCSKDGKFEIQIGGDVFTCPSEGKHQVNLAGFNGELECPSAQEMCQENLPKRCPLDCHGQGVCMNDGTCQCLHGFTGPDCNNGLPKEQDPFVTDFDIRKQNEGENDGDNDGGNDGGNDGENDGDNDGENEEEGDDEREGDDEEEEEKEEEEEENEEEEEEENKPLSEKAKQLIAQLEREQAAIDFWRSKIRVSNLRLRRVGECTGLTGNFARRCARRTRCLTARLNRETQNEARIAAIIEDLKAQLALELTEKQAQERAHDERDSMIARQKQILDDFIVLIEGRLTIDKSRRDFWTRRLQVFKDLFERFKDSGRTRLLNCLTRAIERAQNLSEYYTRIVDMMQEELGKAIAERDDLLGVVPADQAAIRAEMNAEMNEGDVSDYITGNIGFQTESAGGIAVIPMSWSA